MTLHVVTLPYLDPHGISQCGQGKRFVGTVGRTVKKELNVAQVQRGQEPVPEAPLVQQLCPLVMLSDVTLMCASSVSCYCPKGRTQEGPGLHIGPGAMSGQPVMPSKAWMSKAPVDSTRGLAEN